MIRPAEYWESQQAAPGSFIFMEFPELEASGMAQVCSIEPCPPIAEGSGNVVTARIVTRQVSELVEIGFDDDEILTGTPQHPIWSIERQDWVELDDLEIGEHLWTEDGPVEVQSKRLLTTAESVYNLEVHGHHIYQVGELGVLVHNAGGISNYKTPRVGKKRGPKTSNKAPHNAKIIEQRNKIKADGGKILAGGRTRLKEAVIKCKGGKNRRPDILYRDKNGVKRALNVGKKDSKGRPITRERNALRDLRTRVPTTFVPYN